jgi:competence protein ComEA
MLRIALSLVAAACLMAVVPHAALAAQNGSTSSAKAASGTTPVVNINTADSAGLTALPGIGAKTADLIVAYRQKNGPFKKIEELMNVRGIGEKSFLRIRAQITVGDPTSQRPRE